LNHSRHFVVIVRGIILGLLENLFVFIPIVL
jgi:hypothetical protein